MAPPTGGPISGANSAGIVSSDIAPTSSDFGSKRNTTSRPTGTISAPPRPCNIRAATKPSSDDARPQASEPSVNTAIAARKTFRAPNLSATQPETGMNTARLKR